MAALSRSARLLACLVLWHGCASVAGHIRPAWAQSWSEVRYVEPERRAETLRVIAHGPDGVVLPGVTVTAGKLVSVTDNAGVASFDLPPGEVVVQTEMPPYARHRRSVILHTAETCVLDVFSGITVNEITVCCGG